jgi:diguanylate cyclase (GGDEF)-like protein
MIKVVALIFSLLSSTAGLLPAAAHAALSTAQKEAIEALDDTAAMAAYAQEIPTKFDTPTEQAIALRLLGYQWESINNIEQARQAFDSSVRLLEALPPGPELVYSLSERSYITYTLTGDTEQYCPDRHRAMAVARQVGKPEPLVFALVRRAFCFQDPENFQEGLADLQEAMRIATVNSLEKSTLSMIANASGLLYRSNQLHDRAYSAFAEAYAIWYQAGDTQDYFNMLHNMVGEAIKIGRWDAAQQQVDAMFDVASTNPGASDYLFFANFNQGRLALARTDYRGADAALSAALQLQHTTAEKHFIARTQLRRAEARVWLGQFAAAGEDFEAFHAGDTSENANYKLLARLNLALQNNSTAEIVAVMLELRQLEAEKRYSFLNANTRLLTTEHEGRIAEYEASLLKQQLALRELELEQADSRASLTRQSIIILALLAIVLAGLALWLFYLLRLHRKRSQTDFLTGIATRGRVFSQGFRLCEKATRKGEPFAVVVFDIDRFKRINDTLGHGVGDRAIMATVQAVKNTLKPGEILGRLGGEEFVAILPGSNPGTAMQRAEQMRVAVEQAGFVHAQNRAVEFTISAGVACLASDESFQRLVNIADCALYRAKNSGRNRVEFGDAGAGQQIGETSAVGSRQDSREDSFQPAA